MEASSYACYYQIHISLKILQGALKALENVFQGKNIGFLPVLYHCIVKMVQLKYFNEELNQLKMKNKENVKISSEISSLNSYLDENGIIRVGGKFEKSDINNESKHPILMPKGCHISKLIILWCYQKTGHSGRGMTLNEVRGSGFWNVNANSVIRSLIFHCVTCGSLRGETRRTIDV